MPHDEWRDVIRGIARDWLFADLVAGGAPCPRSVVMPLENPDLHDDGPLLDALDNVQRFRCIALGDYEGARIGVLTPKLGAPAVAMTIEVLADLGVRHIVGVGYCGGLEASITCGDFVVPSASMLDDGTTARYVNGTHPVPADEEAHSLLRKMLDESGHAYHCGPVWSTDAVLLESSQAVREWSQRGALGVDMETGALFTLARLRDVQACALLVASDNAARCAPADGESLTAGTRTAATIALRYAAQHADRTSDD